MPRIRRLFVFRTCSLFLHHLQMPWWNGASCSVSQEMQAALPRLLCASRILMDSFHCLLVWKRTTAGVSRARNKSQSANGTSCAAQKGMGKGHAGFQTGLGGPKPDSLFCYSWRRRPYWTKKTYLLDLETFSPLTHLCLVLGVAFYSLAKGKPLKIWLHYKG